MSIAHIITAVTGGVAEFTGFLLVLVESSRVRREELGQISWLRRLVEIIKETVRNPAPVMLRVSAAASTSATGHLTITTTSDEDPMAALRRRVADLEGGLVRTQEQLSAQAQDVRGRLDAVAAEFNDRITAVQERRRTDIARAMSNERTGAVIFLFGVACSLVASLT